MYLILVVVIVYLIIGYFYVNWKRWREFYPTVQFYIICNLLYNFIFFNHTLWAYKPKSPWLNHTIIDLTFSFMIMPIVIMMYLQYFPANTKRRVVYLSAWVAFFTIIEFIFQKKEFFIYDNDWGVYNSVYFNIIMFSILIIHYKRPIVSILIAIPIVVILLFFHHPSFADLK
jgi:hypothetical protein